MSHSGSKHRRARSIKGLVLVVTGPRRAGKTWLLQHLFPDLLLEITIVARLRTNQ